MFAVALGRNISQHFLSFLIFFLLHVFPSGCCYSCCKNNTIKLNRTKKEMKTKKVKINQKRVLFWMFVNKFHFNKLFILFIEFKMYFKLVFVSKCITYCSQSAINHVWRLTVKVVLFVLHFFLIFVCNRCGLQKWCLMIQVLLSALVYLWSVLIHSWLPSIKMQSIKSTKLHRQHDERKEEDIEQEEQEKV